MCFKSSTHQFCGTHNELNTNVNEPLVGKTNERHSANRAVLSITLFSVSLHTLSFSLSKPFLSKPSTPTKHLIKHLQICV